MPGSENWLNNWIAIVNPNSGAGKGERDWPHINMLLHEAGFIFKPHFTEGRKHAIKLTEKLINQGNTKIIVIGGDGTLNEVVNGIMAATGGSPEGITTAMIPVGTGNDWGRMYSISSKYNKAVATLADGRIFTQDVGRSRYFNGDEPLNRYFINMAGTGYDALVTKKTNDMKEKGKSGLLSYLFQLLKGLFKYRQAAMKVEVDGNIVFNGIVFSMNVGICRYNGGGMMQLPKAIPDDGLLDITIIKKASKAYILRNLHKVYDGSFIELPIVETFRGKIIKITGAQKGGLALEIDGETLGNSPFVFDLLPRKIRMVINKKWDLDSKQNTS
jgi:YegS/Rv2252/BmrU family lipid kinase